MYTILTNCQIVLMMVMENLPEEFIWIDIGCVSTQASIPSL